MSKSKKGSKATAGEEELIVYSFLEKQNRPYSVQNIVDALQKNGLKKTGTDRALAALVAKGTVTQKTYGKINIFILAQDKLELPDPEEVKTVDLEIKSLSSEAGSLSTRLEKLRARSAELGGILTLEQAQCEAQRLDEIIELKRAKLADLGDGSKLMSKEEKNKLEMEYFKVMSAWKARKKMVRNIADVIGESSGMKPKEFYEQVGVEVDEDVDMDMSNFPVVQNPAKPAKSRTGRPVKRQKLA